MGIGRFNEVWRTPSTPDSSSDGELEFAPFVRHHRHAGHFDIVQSIEWSSDSRFFLSASKDLTAKIWSLNLEEGFVPTTLGGHREGVLGAWFSKDQESVMLTSNLNYRRLDAKIPCRYTLLAKMELSSAGHMYREQMKTGR